MEVTEQGVLFLIVKIIHTELQYKDHRGASANYTLTLPNGGGEVLSILSGALSWVSNISSATTATTLASRQINGAAFGGSADITVTAAVQH